MKFVLLHHLPGAVADCVETFVAKTDRKDPSAAFERPLRAAVNPFVKRLTESQSLASGVAAAAAAAGGGDGGRGGDAVAKSEPPTPLSAVLSTGRSSSGGDGDGGGGENGSESNSSRSGSTSGSGSSSSSSSSGGSSSGTGSNSGGGAKKLPKLTGAELDAREAAAAAALEASARLPHARGGAPLRHRKRHDVWGALGPPGGPVDFHTPDPVPLNALTHAPEPRRYGGGESGLLSYDAADGDGGGGGAPAAFHYTPQVTARQTARACGCTPIRLLCGAGASNPFLKIIICTAPLLL
jgi:hypothetical protein